MKHDMIEPSPELAESAAKHYAETAIAAYDGMQPYERMLRERVKKFNSDIGMSGGFDSQLHLRDVAYLLNLLDRERR